MKFLTNLLVVVFLSITLFTNLNYATNYYLDSQNGNDSNDGLSPSSAWQTLEHLNKYWKSVLPGDSILFRKGAAWYPSVFRKPLIEIPSEGLHGNENNPIVLGAYGEGPKPIISVNNSPYSRAFYATCVSYFTIQDIEFRGDIWFYALLRRSSQIHHIRLLRITINGMVPGEMTGGCLDFWAEAAEVSPENWIQAPMHNIELAYSEIKNSSNTGIQIYGSGNNWIHHNKFYNIKKSAINFAEGDFNIIEYNIISGAEGPGIKHSAHSHTADKIIIRGNLILNTDGGGIAAYNLTNSQIYNNTIRTYNSESAIFGWTTQLPVLMCGLGKYGFDNNKIMNNIFYGGPLYLWNAEDVTLNYKDGSSICYSHNDLWKTNIFHSNIIYNPTSDKQIYLRSFTENDDLINHNYNEQKENLKYWSAYEDNTVELIKENDYDENYIVKITSYGHRGGAFAYLNNTSILKRNLFVGETYDVLFKAKTDSKSAMLVVAGEDILPVSSDSITSEWNNYKIKFVAKSSSEHLIRCSELYEGESFFINDLRIFKLNKLNYKEADQKLGTAGNDIYSYSLTYKDCYIRSREFDSLWAKNDYVINDISSEVYFKNDFWKSAEDYGDFCLASNSPALGNGAAIVDYKYDLFDYSIPQNTNPDIGAIQTPCWDFPNEPDTMKMVIPDSITNLNKKNTTVIDETFRITAKDNRNNIILNWKAIHEFNNYGFEIQRKTDFNKTWQLIGFVKNRGTNNQSNDYSFIDNNIVRGGNYYYRIKKIDDNKLFKYSKEVVLQLLNNKFILYQNYPNPFNPKTKISYSLPQKAYIKISIHNLLGETVDQLLSKEESEGFHQIDWDCGKLASGIYFLVFHANPNDKSESFHDVKKMLILK